MTEVGMPTPDQMTANLIKNPGALSGLIMSMLLSRASLGRVPQMGETFTKEEQTKMTAYLMETVQQAFGDGAAMIMSLYSLSLVQNMADMGLKPPEDAGNQRS